MGIFSRVIAFTAAVSGLVLVSAPACPAEEFQSVGSRTYLSLRETVSGNDIAPLYEYLDLEFNNVGGRDVSLRASGWLRLDLGDESTAEGEDWEQDLSYAYLTLGLSKSVRLDLGRLYLMEGVASEQVDGLRARFALGAGFGLSVYGGSPVEADFDGRGGDQVYGGRFSSRVDGVYEVGVSYLKEEDHDDDYREETGIDVWVRPVNRVQVQGVSTYNSETAGWMEHTYHLNLGPFAGLRLNGEYSEVNYEHFFAPTTLSAFDPATLNPHESLRVFGGGAEYFFLGYYTASVEYKNFDSQDSFEEADYYGGVLNYFRDSYAAGLSVHRMEGNSERAKYYQYRAYASKDFGRIDTALDLFDVSYDEPINDVDHAFSASAAVGYEVTKASKLGIDLEYSENPFFDSELRAFIKFLYRFTRGA